MECCESGLLCTSRKQITGENATRCQQGGHSAAGQSQVLISQHLRGDSEDFKASFSTFQEFRGFSYLLPESFEGSLMFPVVFLRYPELSQEFLTGHP